MTEGSVCSRGEENTTKELLGSKHYHPHSLVFLWLIDDDSSAGSASFE